MEKTVKVAVIGGGASGLAAALLCARGLGRNSVIILEKQPRTGRKLLATGSGRCNLTNRYISARHYHGDKNIIDSVISHFSLAEIKAFLGSMGIILREDAEGRMYPYSNQASTVLDCLRRELKNWEIEELCDFNIRTIQKENNEFIISSSESQIKAQYLIFATGSQASPLLGANPSGYKLLEELGILTTPLFPALSPIVCEEKYKNIKGVRAKGAVFVTADRRILMKKEGEIQFNGESVSGICVFEVSRMINEFLEYHQIEGKKYHEIKLCADLFPDYYFNDLYSYLKDCRKIYAENKASEIFSSALNRKLSQTIAQICGVASKPCKNLSESDIKKLAHTAKNWSFTPVKSDSYQSAQVSAGGVSSRYLLADSLMSKKIKNLFICGELLDVDGDCGGFNLHFAFGSASLVSKYIIKENR